MLVAAFVAGLVSVVVFMGINLLWKISVHSAFAAGTVTMVILLYGALGAISAVLLLVTGWSRIEMGHHSLTQVAAGALLSALIVFVVFDSFGLIGPGTAF